MRRSEQIAQGKSGEKLFFELALEDLTEAADLFRSVCEATCGVDGWIRGSPLRTTPVDDQAAEDHA
jgi:hypothetical protein